MNRIYQAMKTAQYNGELLELCQQYAKGFEPLPTGSQNVEQYVLTSHTGRHYYALALTRIEDENQSFNLTVHAVGSSQAGVNNIVRQFQVKTGQKLDPLDKQMSERVKQLKQDFEKKEQNRQELNNFFSQVLLDSTKQTFNFEQNLLLMMLGM